MSRTSEGWEGKNPLYQLVNTYTEGHRRTLLTAALAKCGAEFFGRIPALLIGVALDVLLVGSQAVAVPVIPNSWLPGTTSETVLLIFVVLLTMTGLDSVLTWLSGQLSGTVLLNILHDIRVDTFRAVTEHEMGYFESRSTGDLMSVLYNDIQNIQTFGSGVYNGLGFVVHIVVALALMFWLHWQLALFMSILPISLGVLSYWYSDRATSRYNATRATIGRVNTRLEDAVSGIETVKAFDGESQERETIESASHEYLERRWDVIRLRLGYELGTWIVTGIAFIGTFAIGAALILNGSFWLFSAPLTTGTLFTFLLYGKSFFEPVRQLTVGVLDAYENALASSKRIVPVLDHKTGHTARTDGQQLSVTDGQVDYEDVSFSYETDPTETISDMTFTCDSGTLIGIVGPSGAGKSTVAKLLFRFYDVDNGTINIDSTNISTTSLASLRSHLGYVSQNPVLFYGTVQQNIAYAVDNATQEEIVAAARAAGAHKFISELPDGYETTVGERGKTLSGGQRQRVAIARAVLRDPPILVLDEATSHVDNETERQIQQSIDTLAGERTTIVIAHRLSTVRDADKILVVDDGQIVEQGTHEQLQGHDGLYADLWNVQVGKFDDVSASFIDDQIEVKQ